MSSSKTKLSKSEEVRVKSLLARAKEKNKNAFDLHDYCFDKQLEFIQHPSRWKTACCGGRAGKTVADAAYLIDTALKKPRSVALYLTLSRSNAKKLIWPELKLINDRYKLKGVVNEADLSINYNGSFVYASGASTRVEIEKFRGLPLAICIIDEVQSFPPFVQELVDAVIAKRLMDFNGVLALTGTPGPVPSGYFYDACHNESYAHFKWTMQDNPWIEKKSGKKVQALIQEEMERKGVTEEDPYIQREIFGNWVLDTQNLVIRYDGTRNHYEELPRDLNYIFGIDIGYEDSDAIAVLAYPRSGAATYLVDECIQSKQGLTELIETLERLRAKYKPIKMMIDEGGLGKKLAEEMRRRYRIPVQPADKARKFENIEMLNDCLMTKRFMAKKDSRFAYDSQRLEWDFERMTPDKKYISSRFHSDIIDAVLYGFKESPAYSWQPEAAKPKLGSPEWGKMEEEKMFQQDLDRLTIQQEEDSSSLGFDWL